jgi:hypothetical protein
MGRKFGTCMAISGKVALAEKIAYQQTGHLNSESLSGSAKSGYAEINFPLVK